MPTRKKSNQTAKNPVDKLEHLAQQALAISKTARRNRKSLSGDNHYANKLAELRADATICYRSLNPVSAGDSSALAEIIQTVFGQGTTSKERVNAVRDLVFSLKTTWKDSKDIIIEDEGLFPLSILSKANRGYLVSVGRQMNGCYSQGWCDASAVMMRRLLEIVIIEAFEANGIASKIKDSAGNYLHLSDLITFALGETRWTLSRNCKRHLPSLKDAGHISAHGRYFNAKPEDLESIKLGCRIVIEEFLHHAGLL